MSFKLAGSCNSNCFATFSVPASDRIEFIYTECKTETEKCQIGEGDCDSDDDCEYGLICDADGWIGKDFCKAGNVQRLN